MRIYCYRYSSLYGYFCVSEYTHPYSYLPGTSKKGGSSRGSSGGEPASSGTAALGGASRGGHGTFALGDGGDVNSGGGGGSDGTAALGGGHGTVALGDGGDSSSDDLVALSSVVSLRCPLGGTRINEPARYAQCFLFWTSTRVRPYPNPNLS
jgi:hypothetical protein